MNAVAVVLDTNTLVSAALLSNSIARQVFDKARSPSYQLICSVPCFAELADVLLRPKFRKYLTEAEARLFLSTAEKQFRFVSVECVITACRDAKDNKLLELATDADASLLVTGDADLLVLHPFRNIQILTLAMFLDL